MNIDTKPTLHPTKELGNKGEELIALWLEKQNFQILAKNYRTKYGEIDLIATKGEVVAFIEVKTRLTKYFPISMVITYGKQLKLIKTAKIFALKNKIFDKVLRFDVATLTIENDTHSIDYIPNAFQER